MLLTREIIDEIRHIFVSRSIKELERRKATLNTFLMNLLMRV